VTNKQLQEHLKELPDDLQAAISLPGGEVDGIKWVYLADDAIDDAGNEMRYIMIATFN
jgi:hypothetical protein